MSRSSRSRAAALAAAVLLLVTAGCGDDGEEEPVRGQFVRQGAQLNEGDISVGVGSVRKNGEVGLSISAGGELKRVRLRKGESVEVGGHTIELTDVDGSGSEGFAAIDIDP